ncbi:MAG TPA: GMC family oxidoreductase, partial [Polyangiales bacterium]
MLLDARGLASGEEVEVDLCIVGGGPAGLTLASQLADSGARICVLESGGREFETRHQDLSDAKNHGTQLSNLRHMRRRQLGGNSNTWNIQMREGDPPEIGVRYAPLDAYDFEHRPWLAHSGWPFGKEELEPYYARAHEICRIGPYTYRAEDWEDAAAPRLPLDERNVVSGVFRFGPSRVFFEEQVRKLERADNVRLLVHATALELQLDDAGEQVARVKVATVPGHHVYVRAKQFALCLGGLENARLLLLSNRRRAQGLGNQHDLVGRYFMDHPLTDAGLFTPHDRALFRRMFLYDLREVRGTPVIGRLSIAEPAMRAHQLLNATAYLFPRPSPRRAAAVHAIGLLKDPIVAGELPVRPLRSLLQVAAGLDYVAYAAYLQRRERQAVLHGFARGGWSRRPAYLGRFESFRVLLQTEQQPEPQNRVWLGEERDRFGARKLELYWRWNDEDRQRVARTRSLLADALSAHGVLESFNAPDGLPPLSVPAGLAHHMGTTRMHRDPKLGVVDEHCRVHGVHNLFVGGSSVFPTGGYANPTLTVVALAARLADHLAPR